MKNAFKRNNVLAVLLATGIVVATGAAMATGDDSKGGDVPDRGILGSDRIQAAYTDPAGERWGVLEYASRDSGARCLTVGVNRGQSVGMVDNKGVFKATRLSDGAGSCGDWSDGGVVIRGIVDSEGVTKQTVYYGTLAPGQKSLSVTPEGGTKVNAEIGSDGVFLIVFPGMVEPEKSKVEFTNEDGSKTVK